jgi:hypothetical protein
MHFSQDSKFVMDKTQTMTGTGSQPALLVSGFSSGRFWLFDINKSDFTGNYMSFIFQFEVL